MLPDGKKFTLHQTRLLVLLLLLLLVVVLSFSRCARYSKHIHTHNNDVRHYAYMDESNKQIKQF